MRATLRVAIRSLARRPSVPIVAIASLAVGIGVNSTVFSIVDTVYLRPPAVSDPESLVEIEGAFKDSGSAVLDWSDCLMAAEQAPAFSAVTATMRRGGNWRNGDETTALTVEAVGDNYFQMLGVKPALGELPDPQRDVAVDSDPPILLTYWFWREKMGARPDVIGQRMNFRDHIWRIAAVLPREFRGLNTMGQSHVWIPLSGWAQYWRGDLKRGGGQFDLIGRLRPGASLEQAQAQLDALSKRIESGDIRAPKGRRMVASSVGRKMREQFWPGVAIMAVVGLVLLVACANVAGVLLAHAEGRRREIALRQSLGATRLALVRQFLVESAVLALAGAAAGLLLAVWLLSAVPALAPPSSVPLNYDLRIDVRLLLYTAACAMTTLFVFALAPLAYALRVSLVEAISGSRAAGRTPRALLRYGLVTAQIALGVVLVGGATTLARSLLEAQAIYPGYDASRRLALIGVTVIGPSGAQPESSLFQQAADRIAAVGGVESATFARHIPLFSSGSGATIPVVPDGAARDAPPARVYFSLVGPKYFEVTGARLASGRIFGDADHNGGAPVAIINAEAARRFWPQQNALGKVLRIRNAAYQVVGIAVDGRIGNLHEKPRPAVLLPASRMDFGETLLIARTKSDPAPLLKSLAHAAEQANNLRVWEALTLRRQMKEALYDDWLPTVLGGCLALIGLLLASGGLYGALSYATERRVKEIGIRMSVGAGGRQIAGLVIRQAVVLCLVGIPAGVGVFVAAYRPLRTALPGHRPLDLVAILAGALICAGAVLAGTALPALRATRYDPAAVLRAE